AGASAHGACDGRIACRRSVDASRSHGRRMTCPKLRTLGRRPVAGYRERDTYMSQKRLLALVGGLAIFASACGGTTATPSPASQEPGASTPATASAEPSSDLAAEQILNVDIAG